MRKLLLLFSFLLLISCSNSTKNNQRDKQLKVATEKTSVKFVENTHNFGTLTAGEIVLYTFEFTNTGKHDFKITAIKSDCGCVHAHYIEDLVKPGEKGWIEVEFDTAGLVGREYKTIEIHGNSNELKHLAIFAEVKNELLDIK